MLNLRTIEEKKRELMQRRKMNAFSIVEIGIYILVAAILIGAVILTASYLVNGAKVHNAKQELDSIRTACIQYKVYNAKNQYPSALGDLTKSNAISATESLDGMAHGNFLPVTSRFTNDGLIDPWGNQYTITSSGSKTVIASQGGGDSGAIEVELDNI